MLNSILPTLVLAIAGDPNPEPQALDYFSGEALALVDLAGTDSWLNRERLDGLLATVESAHVLDGNLVAKMEEALVLGGFFVGQDAVDAAGVLTAKGAAAGWFGDEKWGLVVRGENAGLLDAMRLKFFGTLGANFDRRGGLGQRHGELLGFDYWNLGDDLSLGVDAATLVVASDFETLNSMLTTALSRNRNAVLDEGTGAHIRAWIDRLGISKRLEEQGEIGEILGGLLQAPRMPAVQFLLGPGLAKIGSSEELSLGVTFGERGVDLALRGTGAETKNGLEPTHTRRTQHLMRSDDLLSMIVYRDIEGIVTRRSELFEVRQLPEFSKALSELAILFGGLEIEADLLPGIGPWMEICVGSFSFGDGPIPELVLPGAAVIMQADPKLESALVTAFQTAVGLVNADLAQKGKTGFALGLGLEDGILVSSARLPVPMEGGAVDNRYNLAPAAAFVNDRFVVGTHAAIVGDVVRGLKRGKLKRMEGESLHLNAGQLGKLLQSSRSALVMNSVLKEGLAVEEAETKWARLGALLGLFDGLDFDVNYLDGGDVELGLKVSLARDWIEAGQ